MTMKKAGYGINLHWRPWHRSHVHAWRSARAWWSFPWLCQLWWCHWTVQNILIIHRLQELKAHFSQASRKHLVAQV